MRGLSESQVTIFGKGGCKVGGRFYLHPTGVTLTSGRAALKQNNKLYLRDLVVDDQIFFIQATRIHAAVVVEVIEDSEDTFYVIQKARMPGWLIGQSASFIVHESRVLPADDPESYVLAQQTFY